MGAFFKKKNTSLPFFFFFDGRVQTIITLILDQLRPSCLQRSRFSCGLILGVGLAMLLLLMLIVGVSKLYRF